jgi:hypothetical protein
MEWINLSPDRVSWQALVNAVTVFTCHKMTMLHGVSKLAG